MQAVRGDFFLILLIAFMDSVLQTGSVFVNQFLSVEVTLGNPAKNCSGLGICFIGLAQKTNSDNLSKNKIQAKIGVGGDGSLTMIVFVNQSTGNNILKFTNKGIFIVTESYTLPNVISELLGKNKIKISPGNYPVNYKKDRIAIVFN